MDSKSESAVRTFIRIEVIILQGVMESLFLLLMGVVLFPLVPFIVAIVRWRATRGGLRWITRAICFPLWFLSGCLFGIVNPIGVLIKSVADIREVVRIEWKNRWMTGIPKRPNGHPLPIRSPEDRDRLDAAITMGVVRDYNDEALAHGQGIVFDGDL